MAKVRSQYAVFPHVGSCETLSWKFIRKCQSILTVMCFLQTQSRDVFTFEIELAPMMSGDLKLPKRKSMSVLRAWS